MIDSAILMMSLETESPDDEPGQGTTCTPFFLHGSGTDRWLDKSFQLILASNGQVSVCLCAWLPLPPALYLTPSFFLSPHKHTDRPQLRALLGRWRRRHALRQRGLRGLLELTTHQQPAAAKQRTKSIELQAGRRAEEGGA